MKGKLISALEIFAATALVLGVTVFAGAGSESDPLVSKSYVDDKIEQVLTIINGNGSASNNTASDNTSSATSGAYQTVYLSAGQIVLGSEGTEIIMRSGKGNVYITGVDGIVDATTGTNLTHGDTAKTNHIMIVPRGDGRGIKATEGAWFLIKGEYSIQ